MNRYFSRVTTNNYMKRCSISTVIMEIQVKTTVKYYTPTMPAINKNIEKLEFSYFAGGKAAALENSLAGRQRDQPSYHTT